MSRKQLFVILSLLMGGLAVGFVMTLQLLFFNTGPTVDTGHQQSLKKVKSSKVGYDSGQRLAISKKIMLNKHDGLTKQGFISIPSLSILLPIYDDAYSDKGLNEGANILDKSMVMGEGNYVLAAHNFNDGKTGFSGLQEKVNENAPYLVNGSLGGSDWLNGQMIYLANGEHLYTYKITKQFATKVTDHKVSAQTSNKIITIVSCLFPNTHYRIITQGELISVSDWASASDTEVGLFDLNTKPTNAHADWFNPGEEEGNN